MGPSFHDDRVELRIPIIARMNRFGRVGLQPVAPTRFFL
jgi:hypothetical protein